MKPDIDPVDNLIWHQRRYAMFGDAWPKIMKPFTGDACNRCGLCCLIYPCAIGRLHFGVQKGECPALEWNADGSICGIIANPKKYMPMRTAMKGASRIAAAAKLLLGAGLGCSFGTQAPGRAQEEAERVKSARGREAWKTLGLLKQWEADCSAALIAVCAAAVRAERRRG